VECLSMPPCAATV